MESRNSTKRSNQPIAAELSKRYSSGEQRIRIITGEADDSDEDDDDDILGRADGDDEEDNSSTDLRKSIGRGKSGGGLA